MADYNAYLQTAAAVSSTIAAIAAVYVARSTFTFQKNFILKRTVIEQLLRLLQDFYYLKSLSGQGVLGAADDEVTGLKQRISDTRASSIALESMLSVNSRDDIESIQRVTRDLSERDFFADNGAVPNVDTRRQLESAISALQRIYRFELK